MDWKKLGLKIGLEIHQQLDTSKLFCSCPSILSEPIPEEEILVRRLRVTRSEMGEIDGAALEAAEKDLVFQYQAPSHTCLVEADEEPPHRVALKTIGAALQVCAILGATVASEIEFMRKIVIDGSNTSGFQRTALVAVDGSIRAGDRKIAVPTICLEEDAARKVFQSGSEITYRLDRLGIPLIEIATEPTIRTPAEARQIAERIGSMLRATGNVKRGIGTIREDLNISIRGGARTEIKGVQELGLIPEYIENEVKRQLALIEAKRELESRGIRKIEAPMRDCTELLLDTKSKVLSSTIKSGGRVLGIKLPGFAGLLKGRLGPELASYAKMAGVAGIFHTDELPAYGITADEFGKLRQFFSLGEVDAFVIVAETEGRARKALEMVLRRATTALSGVPGETRDPLPDGKSVYSRPLPGKARMYPETDIPPIPVPEEIMADVRAHLPEMPEDKIARLAREYGISGEQAEQLTISGMDGEFEQHARKHGMGHIVARTLLNTIPELAGENVPVQCIDSQLLDELFMEVSSGAFAKEGIKMILMKSLADSITIKRATEELGFIRSGISEIDRMLGELVESRADFVLEKGETAIGPLMGIAMKTLCGKVDGKVLNEMLLEKIREKLRQGKTINAG